jgi:uncharacterized protein
MKQAHLRELARLARNGLASAEPSHDYLHAIRVCGLARRILDIEGGDAEVVIPASLFHDLVVFPKTKRASLRSNIASANSAAAILEGLDWYPRDKVPKVRSAIERCSFTNNLGKLSLEEYIVQDADLLDSIGAIAIARTFCSGGQMGNPIYSLSDPAATSRAAAPFQFTLDLFQTRLLRVYERLHTQAARSLALPRLRFTLLYYAQILGEIDDAQAPAMWVHPS